MGCRQMAVGKKYSALTDWLLRCGRDTVDFSFEELSKIIPIPNYAYQHKSAWANAKDPQSFNASWILAGYAVSGISTEDRCVVFTKTEIPNTTPAEKRKQRILSQEMLEEILKSGYTCYDGIGEDSNHRYLSWEYCHKAFIMNREAQDAAIIDYLCLHFAWYLASWGMLRNSFLMQKDYKSHEPVVRLLMQPEWEDLWDISAEHLAQERYAGKIIDLCGRITEIYRDSVGDEPTVTLLTKILLGTIGCTPAYDQYFRKALSTTKAASQTLTVKSLMDLGKLYVANSQFDVLEKYCSQRMEYPAAKIIDMCFFQYGLNLSGQDTLEGESY